MQKPLHIRFANLLDRDGRLLRWPARGDLKNASIRYLASKFDPGRRYAEPEVNAILDRWHVFGDRALLRRLLFEQRYLNRTRDGSAYWMAEFGVVARGL